MISLVLPNRLPHNRSAYAWVAALLLWGSVGWVGAGGEKVERTPFPSTRAPRPSFVIETSPSVTQGEILTVRYLGSAPLEVDVTLSLPGDRVIHSRGWRITGGHARNGGREGWVTLLGIPSTAQIGFGSIEVSALFSGRRRVVRSTTVDILEGSFIEERIALSPSMTTLRSSKDPRKTEQSRTLWEIITTIDPTARFHQGRFRYPLDQIRRTAFFGDLRIYAYSNGRTSRSVHNGVDYGARTGTPILAPGRGRVVMARDRILTGKSVILEHLPGVYTIYYHLDLLSVDEGSVVDRGTQLGTVGSTGLSTGPHLHWELRVASVAVDPEAVIEVPLLDTRSVNVPLSIPFEAWKGVM